MASKKFITTFWNGNKCHYNKNNTITSTPLNLRQCSVSDFARRLSEDFGMEVTEDDVKQSTPFIEASGNGDEEGKFIFTTEVLTEWVEANQSSWDISDDGKMVIRKDGGIPRSSDVDELANAIYVHFLDNGKVTSKDCVKAVLQQYLGTRSQASAIKLAESFKYDAAFQPKCDAYIAAMHRYLKPTQSLEVFRLMVYQWAWQVKRKVLGLEVKNHIWLSFCGGAGIGKTTMVKRILKPFGSFAVDTTLGKILDSTKEIKLLTESYIMNADEIAVNREDGNQDEPLTRDQINVLKAILTGDEITARVYGTQQQARRKISFSVISTSNEHLYNIIFDEATMRRYYEINCTRTERDTGMLEDFKAKCWGNGLNFWKGINENVDNGYWMNDNDPFVQQLFDTSVKELSKTVQQEQSAYYPSNKTSMHWFNSLKEESRRGFTAYASLTDLYSDYKDWCVRSGCKSCSQPRFKETFISKFAPFVIDGSVDLATKSVKWCALIGVDYKENDIGI